MLSSVALNGDMLQPVAHYGPMSNRGVTHRRPISHGLPVGPGHNRTARRFTFLTPAAMIETEFPKPARTQRDIGARTVACHAVAA